MVEDVDDWPIDVDDFVELNNERVELPDTGDEKVLEELVDRDVRELVVDTDHETVVALDLVEFDNIDELLEPVYLVGELVTLSEFVLLDKIAPT